MNFIRMIFLVISVLFSIGVSIQNFTSESLYVNIALGTLGGVFITGILVSLDLAFRRFNLKSFNTAIIGLFVGYLLGSEILLLINSLLGSSSILATSTILSFMVYLVSLYFGLVVTARAADELHLCIPFFEFHQSAIKKKDILLDTSVLTDQRIIDLASSGLLDHQLIIPRFAVKELQSQLENADDQIKSKAKKSLELIKKLESIPNLDMRYVDDDVQESLDWMSKLVKLARILDTNIITSDINRIQQSTIEGVRIINIHMLSHALKPVTQTGEILNIKIQRYGKEPRQGVGYLDDGTMVVVNGGAEFIGETIKSHVLSVKHTSSGRMIFCNAFEEGGLLTGQEDDDEYFPLISGDREAQKSFLTL